MVAVLVAGSVSAQEIGTEITPTTPNSAAQPQNPPPSNTNTNTNPPPATSGYQYKPKGQETGSATPTFAGPKVSATSGDFGIRAGFGSSGSIAIPSGSGASVAAPTVGIAYFAADSFKLLIDLGFGMALVGSSALLAIGANVGFDYMFRTPGDALRPFFHFAGLFNMVGSNDFAISFGAQLGFGAEYFFAPNFSVNGRLMLAVPMSVANGFLLGIFTVTPGVGATWYF
jgi:hypothetical protein